MAKELKSFILSYSVRYEIEAANIHAAVKRAKKNFGLYHAASIADTTNASIVDESTGEEVFF